VGTNQRKQENSRRRAGKASPTLERALSTKKREGALWQGRKVTTKSYGESRERKQRGERGTLKLAEERDFYRRAGKEREVHKTGGELFRAALSRNTREERPQPRKVRQAQILCTRDIA